MAAWKYIHPVDKNKVVDISGTTWKLCKKCVYSVMGKAGFNNRSNTTSEHCVFLLNHNIFSPNLMTLPLQKPTLIHLQILLAIKKGRKQVMKILIMFNGKVSTALWLLIQLILLILEELFTFDLPLKMHQKIKNNYETVIGYLDSYFECFDCHDTPISVDPSDNFLMLVDLIFLQYRSLFSLPLLLCTPLTSFLKIVDTVNPLQSARLT